MRSYKDPDLQQRQSDAAAAKKAMLEKFRAASDDPAVAMRHATRVAVNEARLVRIAEREAAKRAREAELAEQATRAAELALQAQREAEKVEALVAAGQKVARDARYAARKAAKKERRRGY
jgi:hypothetical protein